MALATIQQIKELVTGLDLDVVKALQGNKSATIRSRKVLSQIRELCSSARKEIQSKHKDFEQSKARIRAGLAKPTVGIEALEKTIFVPEPQVIPKGAKPIPKQPEFPPEEGELEVDHEAVKNQLITKNPMEFKKQKKIFFGKKRVLPDSR